MVSAIASIDGKGGGSVQRIVELTNAAAARTKAAQSMVNQMDNDGDGTVSKDEFLAASAERQSTTTSANTERVLPSPEEIFRALDLNSDDAVSIEELSSGFAPEATGQSEAQGVGPGGSQGGGAPMGGGGPKGASGAQKGGKSSAVSGTSSDNEDEEESDSVTDDPADTNDDGEVSIEERLAYEIKQELEGTATAEASKNGTNLENQSKPE
jgi:Ca2+-binding EF-hand superfamily protein